MECLNKWNPSGDSRVYMGVFTHSARHDPRMHKVIDRLVAIPKTLRTGKPVASFAERKGICIGEIAKIARARIVRGLDVTAAVEALRESLPEVPIYAYSQYRTAHTPVPKGVEVLAYQQDNFLKRLGQLRLYVSLVRHETFAMVPLEAQSMGTPVLYRHMPQSLSEYIGHTGYLYESIEEMVTGAQMLCWNAKFWHQLSKAGMANAQAHSAAVAGAALDFALRKVVFRS